MTGLVLPNGFCGFPPPGRKGRDSGPCISSRWGLWTREGLPLAPPAYSPPPRPSKSELRSSRPREGRGEGEEAPARGEGEDDPPRIPPRFFIETAGKFAASPHFFIPA